MRSFSLVLLLLLAFVIAGVQSAVNYSLECVQQDQSSLLQLKNKLVFYSSSDQLVTWNSSSDCCVWQGVTCSATSGHVIALDLSDLWISGGIDNTISSPLFDLHHLQRLDLSWNVFNGTPIPSGIGNLANLLHLDLSYSRFGGHVPIEISSLTTLLTLDLSGNQDLKLENPKLSRLVHNLTRLTELRLDGVDLSAEPEGDQWGHALSSSLPNLRVLSLCDCSLPPGPLHISLVKLQALSVIDLSENNLSSPVPDFLYKFKNLTSLRLDNCSLYGNFPEKIAPTIQTVDLSGNPLLSGTLPETIENLKMMTDLNLQDCGISGSIANIQWENLRNLVSLDLSGNALMGSIPSSLFSHPSLMQLDLSRNQFSDEFPIVSSSNLILEVLSLRSNNLEGPIPTSIFKLVGLLTLDISNNNFTGSIDLTHLLQNLVNLSLIDLSFNSLSIVDNVVSASTMNSSFHNLLEVVNLASCNLKAFPDFLRNQSRLNSLDLSQNKIHGIIPIWICPPSLGLLNLSHNSLMGFQGSFLNLTLLLSIDLSFNQLSGEIPLPIISATSYLDYSNNNFNSEIPFDIGNHLYSILFFSVKNNNLHGNIPSSFCNIYTLFNQSMVDFSSNSLSGIIPPCLIAMNFGVLNLKGNNLSGNIPDAFQPYCSLQILDLSDNQLQGNVPQSMVHCKGLQVVNLGNNEINGGFPCWLMKISSLRVLVLRSNRFHGSVRCALGNATTNSWSMLQIMDIAANSFDGELPYESFKGWKAMMAQRDTQQPELDYLKSGYGSFYQDSVTITSKGIVMEMVKILTIFNSLDFSCNHFKGSIPESIGDLKSLYTLNLSHNHFSGQIPPSLGNLREMESLDLANNNLRGVVPVQLANLNFLSFLNLSFNQLKGRIPTSTQLQSFSEWSYIGNKGLYGPPLVTITSGEPNDPSSPKVENKEIDWQVICAEIGYAVGLGSVIGSLLFWKRWRLWYFARVGRLLFKMFHQLEQRSINHRRRRIQRRNGRQRQ